MGDIREVQESPFREISQQKAKALNIVPEVITDSPARRDLLAMVEQKKIVTAAVPTMTTQVTCSDFPQSINLLKQQTTVNTPANRKIVPTNGQLVYELLQKYDERTTVKPHLGAAFQYDLIDIRRE